MTEDTVTLTHPLRRHSVTSQELFHSPFPGDISRYEETAILINYICRQHFCYLLSYLTAS